jgi:DNA-binding NarL/FixJ family response regulator
MGAPMSFPPTTTTRSAIRVVLVDDHMLMREGLRALLADDPDLEVVGEAANGRDALHLVRELAPDVVVMDISMRDLNGIDATREIRSRAGATRVVALSTFADRRFVLGMLDAGASGYVVKTAAAADLKRAIVAAAASHCFLSPEIAGVVVAARSDAAPSKLPPSKVGKREREIVQLVAEGRSSADIAARMHISPATVDTHRRNVMRKLGLHSIAELTRWAIREGLTSVDS